MNFSPEFFIPLVLIVGVVTLAVTTATIVSTKPVEPEIQLKEGHDEFPGQRRGGGTHADDTPNEFPDRRVGGGTRKDALEQPPDE